MSVTDLYSTRQKRIRGDVPDVYSYDKIPQELRVQIVHIWHATIGLPDEYEVRRTGPEIVYQYIVGTLCHEYGLFGLPGAEDYHPTAHQSQLIAFFMKERDLEKVLDTIELSFKVIDSQTRKLEYLMRSDANARADAAIKELNTRFRQHGVGYQFEGGEIVRVDSQLLHTEAVKPALALLRASEYAGAQAEFLSAHEHYRHARMKEALVDCLKAMESVMKAICAKRKWTPDPRATASELTKVLFDHGLVPPYLQSHFSALKSTLDSGVPTVRNKLAGHGQGTQVLEVPGYLVAYALHLTASVVVFLAEAEKALT